MSLIETKKVCAPEQGLQSYSVTVKSLLSDQILTLLPVIGELRIRKQIEYVLKTTGKNLRATLVFLSGQSLGGTLEELQKIGLAIELLHAASLVHDDVLDREVIRRNTLSVQAKWSVKEAILVGDALASLSLGLCKGYDSEILDVMASTCLQLSDGEYMDVESGSLPISESVYLEKIRKKTATLFKSAARCGSLIAKGSVQEVDALCSFGENFGIAFQIRDDLSDVRNLEAEAWNKDNFFELNGTLPIVRLGQVSRIELEKVFSNYGLFSERVIDRKIALNELFDALENKGCFNYCEGRIQNYVDRAIKSLNNLEESSFKYCLIEMAEQLGEK